MSSHLDSASAATAAASAVFNYNDTNNAANKRKLDDYTSSSSSDDELNYLIPSRMRKDQSTPLPFSDGRHHHQKTSSVTESTRSSTRLHFFVRTISHKTLVIHADRYDTVQSVHRKILSVTGIPMTEQRLIYRGRQLEFDKTLAEYDIENDAGLELVCRMRSTDHPQAWQLVEDVVRHVFLLCRGTNDNNTITNTNIFTNNNNTYVITQLSRPHDSVIKSRLTEFINLTPRTDTEQSSSYLQVFLYSSTPPALVTLYTSPLRDNRKMAQDAIQHFMTHSKNNLPAPIYMQCGPIVLEFCNLLSRAAGKEDPLYSFCRSSLGSIVEHMLLGIGRDDCVSKVGNNWTKSLIDPKDIFPFVSELASKLSRSLLLNTESELSLGPTLNEVRDFTAFMTSFRNSIAMQVGLGKPVEDISEERKFLHDIFVDLLRKMDMCLKKIEEHLIVGEKGKNELLMLGWSQHLVILKELNSISKLYQGAEESFWVTLRNRKASLCHLIVKFAKRTDDHEWILDHKEVTNFEARRHLAMMMLPDMKDEYDELHEMLIDRSQLLAESFEYIAHAEPDSLRGGLFMEFKNEEATGPGVLREWFFLVGQAIFNQQNALFVACPNDRRRFFPNPASKVDPLHLEYFNFSGRVIALALMHKVQIGVVFDRVFFMQLAGSIVTLEDIRDADPYLYSSCKQILEMDPEIVDQDALGLTFVREVEELGSRKAIELCPDGRNITVTSENRKLYVNLLIYDRFVTSIAEQVAHFAKGFGDIISCPALQRSFFQSLDLEDFDAMLHGSESAISVEDWKAHTEYKGFKETDPQILWFWKSVEKMSTEQRKVLLFFWTSIKYLPVEGFSGLASRLYIYKSPEKSNHLPSSHTCFYRLCFPAYPSMAVMQKCLGVITQEHVGCSFGTW